MADLSIRTCCQEGVRDEVGAWRGQGCRDARPSPLRASVPSTRPNLVGPLATPNECPALNMALGKVSLGGALRDLSPGVPPELPPRR